MPTNQQRRDAAKRHLQRQNERRARRSKAMKQRWTIIGVIAAVLVVVGVVWLTTGGSGTSDDAMKSPSGSEAYGDGSADSAPTDAGSSGEPTAPATDDASATDAADGNLCAYPADGGAAKPVDPPSDLNPPSTGTVTATIALNGGDVTVDLDRAATPCTVNSFVSLAEQGYFDDVPCHRLTSSASLKVLQCGDPSGTGTGGPGYSFADELSGSETYEAGTLAMANAGADTNGSQFFIVYEDSQLSPDYTVFGHVTSGLDVVTSIAAAGTAGGGVDGAPADPVTIDSVTIGS